MDWLQFGWGLIGLGVGGIALLIGIRKIRQDINAQRKNRPNS